MEKEIDFYREIVKNAPMAYALHKLLLDDSGAPADYVLMQLGNAINKHPDRNSIAANIYNMCML